MQELAAIAKSGESTALAWPTLHSQIASDIVALLFGREHDEQHLDSPADTIALTSALLRASGAITLLVSHHADLQAPWRGEDWGARIASAAREWSAPPNKSTPHVRSLWAAIKAHMSRPVENAEPLLALRLPHRWGVLVALLELHAIADECCNNIAFVTSSALEAKGKSATLARFPADRGRVLPKFHAAQVGLTMRSATLHATFDDSPVGVQWLRAPDCDPVQPINLLVLPWPFEVTAANFSVAGRKDSIPGFGYFTYSAEYNDKACTALRSALSAAARNLGMHQAKNSQSWVRAEAGAGIDGLVLPECAIGGRLPDVFYDLLLQFGVRFFIVGVGSAATADKWGENKVAIGTRNTQATDASNPAHGFTVLNQYKHHRWCLDKGQVHAYALSRVLSSRTKWWEAIDIRERLLTVLQLHPRCAVSALICEDLARQEPMGQVIRAIGPNLVVALLMDGPQYKDRWSGYYATVLADDPGSSVLAVTSRGMVDRWTSPYSASRRVVALWKEAGGPARELELGTSDALLLTLDQQEVLEYAADGRSAQKTRLTLKEVLRLPASGP